MGDGGDTNSRQPRRDHLSGGDTQQTSEPYYFGHEEQCYYFDNKCHCSSREPYRLPPETTGRPLNPYPFENVEPPLDRTLTLKEIIQYYRSDCDTSGATGLYVPPVLSNSVNSMTSESACSSSPATANTNGPRDYSHSHTTDNNGKEDLPPSYESLYPSKHNNM